MNFRIQSSIPKNNGCHDKEDEKLSEAIETIFPMLTEEAFIIWNTIYIPLNYKYDLSCMIEDILSMLKNLRENFKGNMKINWASDSFACEWYLIWNNQNLKINSKWIKTNGHVEELLNKSSEINIEKDLFTREWKKILEKLIGNLTECGYSIENLIDMNKLEKEFNFIKKYGLLYE
jgi:hypothetical protein